MHQHVVQIGDPVLRQVAPPLRPEDVSAPMVRAVVDELKKNLDRYDAFGLCAPQLGLSARIAVIRCTEKQLSMRTEDERRRLGMEPVDFTVLVNPHVRPIESSPIVTHREGCCSVHGFSALVPRHREVEVMALDETGREFQWKVKGWTARLVQHEVDHLDGKLFTDRMVNDTLQLNYWREVNRRGGDFRLGFGGMKGISHRLYPYFLRIRD